MGDRTYAWFAIPVWAISDETRSVICNVFSLTAVDLAGILANDPHPDPAAYMDGTSLRLVDGVPCLVVEDEQANYGGNDIEEALQAAVIPYLQRNDAGCEYGPGLAAYCNDEHMAVRADWRGEPVIGVQVGNGTIAIDETELVDLKVYAALRAQVLSATRESARS